MAVRERSLGPFYAAWPSVNVAKCPVHTVGLVQMNRPWRRGRGVLFPIWRFRAIILGLWVRSIEEDIDADFEDDRWFKPQWVKSDVREISDWKTINEKAAEES